MELDFKKLYPDEEGRLLGYWNIFSVALIDAIRPDIKDKSVLEELALLDKPDLKIGKYV